MRIAGLMSGTSVDGVDVVIVDFDGKKAKTLAFDMVPYPAALRKQIFQLFCPQTRRIDNLCHLNFVIGEFFASALVKLARKSDISLSTIDLVGSHGQTIYHIPQGRRFGRLTVRSTLQIGEPSVIAERTGITTVADFRPRDIAAGGEGAPLVPYADYILFGDKRKTRILQNIGGIANVTYLPSGGKISDILAFDTGPGNMIIDHLTSLITKGRQRYDADGKLAGRGKIHQPLLRHLMGHDYLTRTPPKSTGRETFGQKFTENLYRQALQKQMDPLDLLATATAFTAKSIADAYRRFLLQGIDEVILCGGGVWNNTLVKMIQQELPQTRVRLMTDFGIDPDAKEAVSFAILAYATIHGITNNVPSATGAGHPVILGKIIPGGLVG